jgi:hypothetical protein
MTRDRFDVVVARAGHNSLVTAAYLAKAGLRCLVLGGPGDDRRQHRDRRAHSSRLPARLLLHRSQSHPGKPNAPFRRVEPR